MSNWWKNALYKCKAASLKDIVACLIYQGDVA